MLGYASIPLIITLAPTHAPDQAPEFLPHRGQNPPLGPYASTVLFKSRSRADTALEGAPHLGGDLGYVKKPCPAKSGLPSVSERLYHVSHTPKADALHTTLLSVRKDKTIWVKEETSLPCFHQST